MDFQITRFFITIQIIYETIGYKYIPMYSRNNVLFNRNVAACRR
jgi:hypothetical protein